MARMLSATAEHLDCTLGALLIPERHLRLVYMG
jgi:hypothetical protein